MGTQTNRPHFGTLKFNKETRVIRVKVYNGHSLAAFELKDDKDQVSSQSELYSTGDWAEYKLLDGEVVTGIKGIASQKYLFQNLTFIVSKLSLLPEQDKNSSKYHF